MKLNYLNKAGLVLAMALPLAGYAQTNYDPYAAQTTANTAPSAVAARPLAAPSNVNEVVKLSSAGLGNDVVLSFVNGSQSLYNLSADDIVHLKDSGVSPAVITAMLNHDMMLRNNNPYGPGGIANTPPAPPQTVQAPPVDPNQSTVQQPPTTVVVQQPSPVVQTEYIPISPGPDYYWAPGYWGPSGVWIGGGWLRVGFGYGWGWGGGYRGWGGYYGRGGWGGGYHGGGFHGGGGGFHGGHR